MYPGAEIRKDAGAAGLCAWKTIHEGASVPVIDLRLRMNVEAAPFDDDTCIVILRTFLFLCVEILKPRTYEPV